MTNEVRAVYKIIDLSCGFVMLSLYSFLMLTASTLHISL